MTELIAMGLVATISRYIWGRFMVHKFGGAGVHMTMAPDSLCYYYKLQTILRMVVQIAFNGELCNVIV